MDDFDLRDLASRQGHVFKRSDASHLSDDAVRWRLASGKWSRLRHGIYVESEVLERAAEDPLRRHALDLGAAALSLGRTSAGSHDSAARLHGMALLYPHADRPRLTANRGTPLKRPDLEIDVAELWPKEIVVLDALPGVPVTAAARTVVDIARERSFAHAVVTADSALHLGLCGSLELAEAIDRCAGWPGVVAARAAIEFADPFAESPNESLCRVACHEGGLPAPQSQLWISDRDGFRIARADLGWEERWTLLEADGLVKYRGVESSPTDPLALEKLRQHRLEQLGWEVVRVLWEEALHDRQGVAQRVREAMARAARRHAA